MTEDIFMKRLLTTFFSFLLIYSPVSQGQSLKKSMEIQLRKMQNNQHISLVQSINTNLKKEKLSIISVLPKESM